MTYSTNLTVLEDFTADRDRLTKTIKSLVASDTGTANGSTGDDSEADTGAAYTQDDTEFNIFNTDRQLAALESAVKSCRTSRLVVYVITATRSDGVIWVLTNFMAACCARI